MPTQSFRQPIQHTRRNFILRVLAGATGFAVQSSCGRAAPFPEIKAYRNPGCGCCEKWVQHLKDAGFAITMEDDGNLAVRKAELGVPDDLQSCHTAIVGDYIIEGHVPAEDIILFLAENPDARGLAVPDMPMGSPGMEMDGMKDAYDVVVFSRDGSRKVYAHHS